MNFYNDNDPRAAAWLRTLIEWKIIPDGVVDSRSILDIKPEELHGYRQVHLFAGIGGWAFALQLAHWPEEEAVWSLSCPCQPLSCGGKRKGHADKRHLWPAVYQHIAKCRPSTLFGEQVAGQDGLEWFAGVRADLEGAGYACGGAVVPAASQAPHRRERIFFVADANGGRRQQPDARVRYISEPHENGPDGMGNAESGGRGERGDASRQRSGGHIERASGAGSSAGSMADSEREGLEGQRGHERDGNKPRRKRADKTRSTAAGGSTGDSAMAHTGHGAGCAKQGEQLQECYSGIGQSGTCGNRPMGNTEDIGCQRDKTGGREAMRGTQHPSFWSNYDIIPCRDGKARRIESQPQQMANGVSDLLDALRDAGVLAHEAEAALSTFPLVKHPVARTMLLHGYGNAIVPEVAADFIGAYLDEDP